MNNLTISQVLRDGRSALKERGIESYSLDALVLLMWAAGYSKVKILSDGNETASPYALERFAAALDKRLKNMPVQYITGFCEFMSLDFYVDENVLIPRHDTETLVLKALDKIKTHGYKNVIDLCTGSGCIAVSIAHYAPETFVTAIDISGEAIKTAEKNAAANGVSPRINFIQADVNEFYSEKPYDIAISNPPYIKSADICRLDENVKFYEPSAALDGGTDGLNFYRVLTARASCFLKKGGLLLVEIGCDQANDVIKIFNEAGFADTSLLADLAGKDRVVYGSFGSV